MKRFLTVLLAVVLLGGISVQAAPISKSRALDIAKRVLASQSATKAVGDVKLLWDGEDVSTKANVQPAFYVFTRDNGGFVIVAGDDNVTPILAISDHNEFKVEGMPENVKWWMDRMKAYVRATKVQSPAVRDQWANLVATKSGKFPDDDVTNKVEHLTPEWDQGNNDAHLFGQHVYDKFCPKDPQDASYQCVTGCVATSLGEVLTTLSGIYGVGDGKLPEKPLVASVEPYTVADPKFVSIAPTDPYPLNTTYQWAGLRDLTNYKAIQAAITAGKTDLLDNLGHLLADLGAMMHAAYSYKAGGTSAVTSKAVDTMARYMGMNKSAYYDEAANYSKEHWAQKLKAELYKHPIIYNGRTKPEPDSDPPFPGGRYGHAFVFDGYGRYGGDDVFHVNFGWSGSCNGYYVETNLDSNGEWEHNYSYFCGAIFDFYPAPDSQYEAVISLVPWTSSEHGLSVSSEIKPNVLFDLSYYSLKNTGKKAFIGTIRATLIHKDNSKDPDPLETLFVLDSENPLKPNYGLDGSTQLSVSSVSFGDRIILEYSAGGSPYKKVDALFDGNYATMITEIPLMPVAFIETAASYGKNDFFEFRLKNHGCNFADTQWTITDPDGVTVVKPQSDGMFQLTKKGAYKIEAAVKPEGSAVSETLVTYIEVK